MRVGWWQGALVAVVLCVVIGVAAGCGSTVSLPKTYSSAALGVSFRYPATWHLSVEPVKKGGGGVSVAAPGDSAGVSVDVVFTEHAPFSFSAADGMLLSDTKQANEGAGAQVSLRTVGGLRLVEVESETTALGPKYHSFEYNSGIFSNAHLEIDAGYADSQAAREKATVQAILASMHFSQPKG
jgi:hypothetical protein